jgi:sortase A
MSRSTLLRWLCGLLLCSGGALLAHAGYIQAKALLAEQLIARAFERHLIDGRRHRPWSWADIAPVARLRVPRLGLARHVLDNASGTALAFGLGAMPGEQMIAGHRDSWATFVGELRLGDSVWVERRASTATFRVCELRVVLFHEPPRLSPDELALTTCYPINGIARTDRRLVARLCPAGRIRSSADPDSFGRACGPSAALVR